MINTIKTQVGVAPGILHMVITSPALRHLAKSLKKILMPCTLKACTEPSAIPNPANFPKTSKDVLQKISLGGPLPQIATFMADVKMENKAI